jgi:hypothetical protein
MPAKFEKESRILEMQNYIFSLEYANSSSISAPVPHCTHAADFYDS